MTTCSLAAFIFLLFALSCHAESQSLRGADHGNSRSASAIDTHTSRRLLAWKRPPPPPSLLPPPRRASPPPPRATSPAPTRKSPPPPPRATSPPPTRRPPPPPPRRSPPPTPRASPPPSSFPPPPRKAPPPPPLRRIAPTEKGTASPGPLAGGGGSALLGGGDCPDAQRLLDAANRLRALHGSPPLEWSTRLAAQAQAYADELAGSRGCALRHDAAGECLLRVSSVPAPDDSCSSAVNAWYGELAWYDFKTPNAYRDNWSNSIGHFTQLVWRDSTQIGCGVGTAAERTVFPSGKVFMGGCKAIVCRFDPPGNAASDAAFKANVLPLKSATG
ncbi:hypothetical protein HYH03_011552 [Edaphochlamys debaryana]|uniref:SCP domain-containing protein n=1 Tax=Edaphochlamys debaryana TaxID=47281 RepID=A0A835XUE1_9CHLO|nr:hypothetical protein HYH03_011552 [Edaphochlamys debaryana]|eukprot:KAG2489915.1 hypothetical protein HYH03_011552 [Edaphochlamys debaryana]